jgi:hypothetical protein
MSIRDKKDACLLLFPNAFLVSALYFALDNFGSQLVGLFSGSHGEHPPALEVVTPPPPGNDDRAGLKEGRLNGNQIPAIAVLSRLDVNQ